MDSPLTTSLREARRRTSAAERRPASADGARSRPAGELPPVLALQRLAGNSAVSALLAAKVKGGGDTVAEIDAALPEARKAEPDLPVLEKGLKAAKAAGVPVDIDGEQQKPPPSALAVTKTGFGPASVPAKKPMPPAKPTPPRSPLGKAGARPPVPKGGGKGKAPAAPALPTSAAGAAAPTSAGPVDKTAPPVPPPRLAPAADPAFTAVTGAVGKVASAKKAHPPAAAKAKEAQDAAVAPSDDVDSQAKAAKVDTMDAQPAGSFDKKAFVAAVKAAVEAKSPKNLEEADEYKKSGKAGEVKGEVKGLVSGNKQQATAAVETATEAPPDESKAVAKPVSPLQQEDPGPPTTIPAAGAVPKPAPPEQVNLAAGKQQTEHELADAEVSEDQLAKSNEPEFTGAVAAKKEAAQHADSAPGEFRQQEAAVLTQTKAEATEATTGALTGMHGTKAAVLAQVTGQKTGTKSKDETRRAEVATKIQNIFKATEAEVKKILEGIDPKVEKAFEDGEKGARAAFEGFVEAKMSAYKKDRYGGWLGGYRWLKDKIAGMPSKVNEFFEAGREVYLKEMDRVISTVADIVGADLNAAKKRIADGKAEIAAYVKSLPKDLQQVGAEAAKEVGDQFERLESDVAAKQDALVDTLASKYVDARKGLDDRIEELQAENKGLVDKAIGAIKAVVQTILKLKDMLLGVLARAAGAVGKIIKDPIGFLGNFINAVKGGIQNFASNIWEHLKKGLQAWLFGALAQGGVEIPETLDLKGLLKLVASIFGLTWMNIRSRIAKKIGEPIMAKVESGLDFIKLLATEGLAGIWQLILQKVGDLKDMVVNQIQDMVVTQIVKAGITWLISMLNPAGAFIKACKMIYDVVMFFVEKADQIKEFVDAVLDSVESIVGGGVGAVASKIEQTLAKMLPVLIGFLASLLGLGGISEKIKKIIETVQKPINKAVDWVVGKAVSYGKKFLGAFSKIGKKVKGKIAAGKAYVKGKVEAGKAYVRGKARAIGERLGIIRKPFQVGRESHTLTADAASGQITMASSAPGPVAAKIRGYVERANVRRQAQNLPPLPVEPQVAAVLDRVNQLNARIRQAKAGQSGEVQGQLDQLAVAITDLLVRLGGSGASAALPSGLGNVAPHGRQVSSNRNDPSPDRWMESEHVIPVRVVSLIFSSLGEVLPIERGTSEDNRQHTIMIYKGAATSKTRGAESSDHNQINQLKELAQTGMPRALGRGIMARRLRETMNPAQYAAFVERLRAKAAEVRTALASKLPAIAAARADRTIKEVAQEHTGAKKTARGHDEVLPAEDQIRSAAALQAADVAEIFIDRVRVES